MYSERRHKTFIFESMEPYDMYSAYAYKATQNERINETDTNKEAMKKIKTTIKSLLERDSTFKQNNSEIEKLLEEINNNKLVKQENKKIR